MPGYDFGKKGGAICGMKGSKAYSAKKRGGMAHGHKKGGMGYGTKKRGGMTKKVHKGKKHHKKTNKKTNKKSHTSKVHHKKSLVQRLRKTFGL